MPETPQNYWAHLMGRLNSGEGLDRLVPGVLKDLCAHFDYAAGFVYEADYKGSLHLIEKYTVYEDCRLPGSIEPERELGESLAAQLTVSPLISFREEDEKGPLEARLEELYGTKSMAIVPITDQAKNLIGLVGIVDRRGKPRKVPEDSSLTYSVLSVVAMHIKMHLYQTRIDRTQKSLVSILDNMGVDVYVNDFYTHEILYLNKSMAQPYGGVEAMMGKVCWQTLYSDKTEQCEYCPQKKLIDDEGKPTKVYSWDYRRPFDGSWFRVLSAAFRWVDGRLAHVVSSIDITEQHNNEQIIQRLAEYDHLTGLPNRYKLTADCDLQIEQFARRGEEGYLLFFDLDGFKSVNDTLGHESGDELLIKIGEALQSSALTRDKSYRYGGDEFVVLCDNDTPVTLSNVVDFLTELFAQNWKLSRGIASCGASIGISHYPSDSVKSSELLRCADQAMYEAKHRGNGLAYLYNRGNFERMGQARRR